jgi:hypothetical protein
MEIAHSAMQIRIRKHFIGLAARRTGAQSVTMRGGAGQFARCRRFAALQQESPAALDISRAGTAPCPRGSQGSPSSAPFTLTYGKVCPGFRTLAVRRIQSGMKSSLATEIRRIQNRKDDVGQ